MTGPPEPEIVTLTKMVDNLTARIAEAETALADTVAVIASAALAAERGDDEALRTLAASEKRRDKQAAELDRLRLASAELDRQLAAERDAAEVAEKRELVRQYVDHRDALTALNLEMLEAIEKLAPLAEQARTRGRAASQLGIRLGLGDARADLGPMYGWLKTALDAGTLHGNQRSVATARAGITKPWRDSAIGRRAVALLAALGEESTP